jgi:uncharacterized protein YgiM (DUF1202 family)
MAQPSWTVARQRVDNYAAGFLGAGAGAVIADAYINVSYEVRAVVTGHNVLSAWRSDPNYNHHERSFASVRHPGYTNYLDPDLTNSVFYRAVTTKASFTTAAPAAPALRATTSVAALLRSKPSETASVVTTLAKGTALKVTGRLVTDAKGRTWAPVRTASGKNGFVAAWLVNLTGSAVPVTTVIVRSSPSLTASKVETLAAGTRVTVLRSTKDSALRVWINVRTPSGHAGWMAAWLVRP